MFRKKYVLPLSDIVAGARVQREWHMFFNSLADACGAPIAPAGTTAERPARYLNVGMQYYDTTLGKPIWLHAVSPIVWHDASGDVV